MTYQQFADKNYKRFCALDGSEYIASEYAIKTILRLIETFKVKNILELGLGIGAICDSVLQYGKMRNLGLHYAGTEANAFCLDALQKNVIDYDKIELYAGVSKVPVQKFDLIIVDGADDSFAKIANLCHNDTIIYIEGDRAPQTQSIKQIFPNARHVNVITLQRNREYAHGSSTPETYMGGGQLIFTNPSLGRKLFWFAEKVKTYVRRNIRELKRAKK
ncbi:MAG TPA: hypothetical protein PLS51_00050 [Flavobacterium sp.]|jgi:phospholipid N-methyltransferase|nr:hypothetical protein [Flavobacterium sp.]HPJ08987.1 hypothetical protein [Flavobacterium sp.]